MHWTGGSRRDLQAVFQLRVYIALKQSHARPPAPNASRSAHTLRAV
jgi:hypothetical protein